MTPQRKREGPSDVGGEHGREKRRGDSSSMHEGGHGSITVFRLLCPSERVGSLLGRGGVIMKALREETGARILLADGVPGASEKEVVFSSKEVLPISELQGMPGDPCPAQVALLKAHAKIFNAEGESGEIANHEGDEGNVTARLLVPATQIGSILGKGGAVISNIRKETGAQVRILPKQQLPECARPNDELLQMSGTYPSVRKGLVLVLERLRANPPKEFPVPSHGDAPGVPGWAAPAYHFAPHSADLVYAGAMGEGRGGGMVGGGIRGGYSGGAAVAPLWPLPSAPYPVHQGQYRDMYMGGDAVSLGAVGHSSGMPMGMPLDVALRVLCPDERVGFVIGKGGSHVQQLLADTGAYVKVGEKVDGCDERIVHITSKESLGAPTSGAEEALVRVVSKLTEELRPKAKEGAEDKAGEGSSREPGETVAKMLLPKGYAGCILGKGGSIISRMRSSSGANIRLQSESLPKCAEKGDELVLVTGDAHAISLAMRLIFRQVKERVASVETQWGAAAAPRAATGPGRPGTASAPYPYAHDAGHHWPSPGASHPNVPLSVPGGSTSFERSYEERGYSRDASGHASSRDIHARLSDTKRQHSGGTSPTPMQWKASSPPSQSAPVYPMGTPAVEPSAGISTLLLSIPALVSGAIIGKGGSNIAQIRSISGAKVHLRSMDEGETERIVEVVGTTDQVQAAQALVQAFVIKGTAAAAAAAASSGPGATGA